MKIFKYIPFLISLLSLSACSEDILESGTPATGNNDGTFTIDVSVSIPEMVVNNSRAMGDAPDYAGLQLYLVAFAMNDANDPTANFYINNYQAYDQTVQADGVHFKVTLLQTEEPRVLHLIAVPKDVTLNLGQYGSEEMISRLTTSAGNDAYWQRVEFPNGYGTVDDNGTFTLNADTKAKLTQVPMIRNFARVAVGLQRGFSDPFTLEGFMVVNTPSAGTVAPWGDMKFPTYIGSDKKQLDYDALNYHGILAGGATFENSDVANNDNYTTAPKYLYERPRSSVNPTCVIVKGRYNGEASSYYKIDLGRVLSNGVFENYNILRNFQYTVTITGVTTSGYSTPEAALAGVTYNNLSFDVNTEKMLNISNGTAMLWVTQTTEVVTKEENRVFYFGYKYKPDLNQPTVDNSQIDWSSLNTTNSSLNGVVLSVQEVAGIPEGYDATQYADYKFFRIETAPIGVSSVTGSFVVVNSATGLGRKINIVVSPPFEITRNRIFAGNYNIPDQFPYNRPTWENYVETELGKPLTIFFTLDDELPEAIFPLVFDVEANPQDIENNPIGTLVVTSGPSDFPGLSTQRRIKYQKIVTWQNYNEELDAAHPFGLIVPDKLNDKDGSKGLKIRRVRCRLRTINGVTASQVTKIRITNPYFKQGRWEKFNYSGESLGVTEAKDVVEMTFTRDPGHKFENGPVSNFKDWTTKLPIDPTNP